jgi:hypothetical protein
MNPLASHSITQSGWIPSETAFNAGATRGSYHPFHFLVSLRSDMHQLLDQHPGGISKSSSGDFALLDAFSTYFHETIHWWQHIGSTTGLLLSLSPPMQTHINYAHLQSILPRIGPIKPLTMLTEKPPGTYPLDVEASLNRIVNNWHDLEFNRRIIFNPKNLSNVLGSPYFESQGHSIEIGLANLLLLLGATFDSEFRTVPHPMRWESPAAELRNKKVEGFFFGSSVRTAPIGALHIFEGQARFSQLQYLYLTSNGNMSWDAFRQGGMLSGVYVEAFETFLRLTGGAWPSTPVAADVLLFLLICDLAVNPSDGYPFDIRHFESLIESADPGIRFCWFCSQVAKQPKLRKALERCGSEQYLEVSDHLCKSLVCETPVGIARQLMKWVSHSAGFANLLLQESTSKYSYDNLPLRLCFAKHLRFAEQRIRRPEFFCWPAMYLTERGCECVNLDESLEIFNRHQPPFVAHPNGEIRPALFEGISEANIYETFNAFYYGILQYHLVNQWIVGDGPHDLDFTWMHPLYTPAFTKPWADKAFQNLFGISLDDFKFS